MNKSLENGALRDRVHVFEDRHDAGISLAGKLVKYKGTDGIVLAIPAGGVPVATEIASFLGLTMDLVIVRKIQIPYNPEAGFGAMGPDGEVILNESLLNQLNLTDDEIRAQTGKTFDIVEKRNELFRGKKPFPSLTGRIVIVVDDGLASGYTMHAAIRFIKKMMPKKIIVAVPTASKRTIDFILPEVDELVCLNVRSGLSFSVADAYRRWYDLTDDKVISLIKERLKSNPDRK